MSDVTPYFRDESVTLWHGDSLAILRELPDQSVDCCVTSPPYFGLRDYGEAGQYGLEASPAEYVETMRAVFAEVRRVLADDGTLWLNIGDSYYSGRGNPGPNSADEKNEARRGWVRPVDRPGQSWGRPKSLLGIPWRVAFALQDEGWTLRNEIIWAKPNGMPEPVVDRFASKHEHLFLMAKSRTYWFDLDAVKVEGKDWSTRGPGVGITPTNHYGAENGGNGGLSGLAQRYKDGTQSPMKNPGDVWTMPTVPFAESHFAVMPLTLAERAVIAGCKPGGVVLDPFSGSGTTGLAAARNGRRYVGIDLSSDYLDLSLRTRLSQPGIDFGGVA